MFLIGQNDQNVEWPKWILFQPKSIFYSPTCFTIQWKSMKCCFGPLWFLLYGQKQKKHSSSISLSLILRGAIVINWVCLSMSFGSSFCLPAGYVRVYACSERHTIWNSRPGQGKTSHTLGTAGLRRAVHII